MNDGDFKLPPKKRNWKKGQWQLGFFVRTPEGATITVIQNDATKDYAEETMALYKGHFGRGGRRSVARKRKTK